MRVLGWIFLGIIVAGILAAGSGEDSSDSGSSSNATSTEQPKKAKPDRPTTADGRLRQALSGQNIKVLDISDNEVAVTFRTPEGGLDGASTGDLNDQAAETFHAIYGKAGFSRKSVVVFQGGLVDSETGKNLPEVNTGIFSMSKAKAAQIDWADEDVWRYTIDWTLYRDFVHPALKKDDD